MKVEAFAGGGFAENGYLVICPDSGGVAAVDPGAASQRMVERIRAEDWTLEQIYLTHAHLDHVEGLHRVHALDPDVPIWLHPADRPLFDGLAQQAGAFGMSFSPQPEPTHAFEHGQDVSFGGCTFAVRFAPGHAPGHVILVAEEHGLALVGDVVFQGSIGRTDLPGGDLQTLMSSIREQVLTLPDETRLYTGHGPATTVGRERATNPFLVGHFGGELA